MSKGELTCRLLAKDFNLRPSSSKNWSYVHAQVELENTRISQVINFLLGCLRIHFRQKCVHTSHSFTFFFVLDYLLVPNSSMSNKNIWKWGKIDTDFTLVNKAPVLNLNEYRFLKRRPSASLIYAGSYKVSKCRLSILLTS